MGMGIIRSEMFGGGRELFRRLDNLEVLEWLPPIWVETRDLL